tara:strand:- start:6948 stop:7931 length:984 start_codon:yes stop_codon:yes gene_type:complete
MKKCLTLIGLLLVLSGCSQTMQKSLEIKADAGPPRIQPAPLADRMAKVPELDGKKMTIAVYSFLDKTGQRKPADNIANLSSAVTQGSEVWVIKALSEVGNETWFEVVERVGMDNLIKERQLIRNTRQAYEKDLPNGPRELKPMVFAGLILEGGIIGYDSNVAIGGVGARYLGLGMQTEYRVDTVTVVMRVVSVSSGKVLLSIATEKTIASSRSGADIFRFLDMGTKLLESETGYSVNEPTNYAVRAAIEAGVVQLVYEGETKGLWKFKDTSYKGKLPKPKPLPMKEALHKWPEERLYCDKVDLCWPIEDAGPTIKREKHENKHEVHK